MIGVICSQAEEAIVREFFELFKTPWEFYRGSQSYDVIISTGELVPADQASLVIIYGAEKKQLDLENGFSFQSKRNLQLEYSGFFFPVYGPILTFGSEGNPLIKVKDSDETVGIIIDGLIGKIFRIGFNIFEEVCLILSSGQPAEFSQVPTIEIHIDMLRQWIVGAGILLIEVPPTPPSHEFFVCLTHDVDFAGIRRHKLDHTMWGFLYRALFRSFLNALRGRMSWGNLKRNWKAVFLLPAVHLGLTEDFWLQFDQYAEIEKSHNSTFFLIPFRDRAGKNIFGEVKRRRAVKYDVFDLTEQIESLILKGFEIGVHGIDAWHDSERGRQELERISLVTGKSDMGIRMHWLYFNENSPKILEEAGFTYDSTIGYNGAIGYRAGTGQVYRPPGAKELLELPLHIQDTALFYSDRMGLSEKQALAQCERLIENAVYFGGVLVINWHERSLAPERLWKEPYEKLLNSLHGHRVWFGSGEEVVRWFSRRRRISFDEVSLTRNTLLLKIGGCEKDVRPPYSIRIHNLAVENFHSKRNMGHSQRYYDIQLPVGGKVELSI